MTALDRYTKIGWTGHVVEYVAHIVCCCPVGVDAGPSGIAQQATNFIHLVGHCFVHGQSETKSVSILLAERVVDANKRPQISASVVRVHGPVNVIFN